MATTYSTDTIGQLEKAFADCQLKRPIRRDRYEDGTELLFPLDFIEPAPSAQVKLRIERFVGGGYAGQVYRVQVLDLTQNGQSVNSCASLSVGSTYAMKILIPPSGLGCLFRNTLYAIGFQGSFQLQVNPVAAMPYWSIQRWEVAERSAIGSRDAPGGWKLTITWTSLNSGAKRG
jgi:hypothetical protein